MTTQRRSRRSFVRRRPVRTSWANHTLQEQVLSFGSSTITSDMFDGLTTGEKADVGTVLTVQWQMTMGLSSANGENHGRWGIALVSEDAFTAGSAPTPLEDHKYPWYWNEGYALDEPTLDEHRFRGQTGTRRKMPSVEHILMFAIESSALSAGNLKFNFAFRLLYSHK